MEPEQQIQNLTPQNKWKQVTPLSKYLAMALFVALPFIGGWVGYTYAPDKATTTIQEEIESKDTTITREIMPGGYVINNSLFYSPELDLAFTGRLTSLKFRDGLFYEDRPYDGRVGDAVTEEDILSWDYIRVFPKVSTELSPEDVLNDLIRTEGKNPEDCLINNYSSAEEENLPWSGSGKVFYIHNKDTYKAKHPEEMYYKMLTREEVYNILKPRSEFSSGMSERYPTYSEYKTYCESGDSGPECLWDYDNALGIQDADACTTYAENSSGGFFLFSDGETNVYDENFGLHTTKRDEMPFFFVRQIETKDTSPWLWTAMTDIDLLLLQ